MSAILILPLINNYQGSGLAKYTVSSSFTMSIARFTIGNISNGNRSDYLIITISDVLTMLVLFIFYIHWRRFHQAVLEEMSKDYTVLNPSSYVVSIEEFYDETTNIKTLEQELKGYFDSIYKGAFEV
jgi:neutral trehalase